MNRRRMLYAGRVKILSGVGVGLVLANIVKSPFTSRPYRHLERTYMVIGGAGGFIIGASLEGLRQLKDKRDREEHRQPPASHAKE